MILYVGMFGLEGFGFRLMTLTNPNVMDEGFNTITGTWLKATTDSRDVIEINPAGELHLAAYVDATAKWQDAMSPMDWNDYTCEVRMKVDSWGSPNSGFPGNNIAFVHGSASSAFYVVAFYSNRIYMIGQTPNSYPPTSPIDNAWHVWRWTVDHSGTGQGGNRNKEIKLYEDGILLCTWTHFYEPVTSTITNIGCVFSGAATAPIECHIDYWQVKSGIVPPSGGGGDGGSDPLAQLKALIHQYGTPISALGVIVTLISGIVFILPAPGARKPHQPSYWPY